MPQRMPDHERIRLATLIRVTGPGFTAGLLIYRGDVVDVAPILRRWVRGYARAADAIEQLQRQGYYIERLGPMAEAPDTARTLLQATQ